MSISFDPIVVFSLKEVACSVTPSYCSIHWSSQSYPATRDGTRVTIVQSARSFVIFPVLISLEEVDFVVSVDKGGVHVVQSRCQAVLVDGSCSLLGNISSVV